MGIRIYIIIVQIWNREKNNKNMEKMTDGEEIGEIEETLDEIFEPDPVEDYDDPTEPV